MGNLRGLLRTGSLLGAFSVLVGLSFGCNEPDSFSSLGPTTLPSPTSTLGNTNYVLQTFKPALAVRGASCMLCHAQVKSSIITDFGYGDAQYFVNQTNIEASWPGNGQVSNNNPLTVPWYGNYFGTYQLAQINGTIVVPKAMITDSRTLTALGQSSPISIAQMVALNTSPDFYTNGDASALPWVGQGSIDSAVTPISGNPKVVEIDQMYIGAPTSDQISALTNAPGSSTVGFQAIAGSSVSGLAVQTGTGGSYVTNTGVLNCTGDVVVTGTLLLNNVVVNTDNNGCRLLVTQSAFLQGPVDYTSTSGSQNLQISSARAVMMGFSMSGSNTWDGQTANTPSLIVRLQTTDKYPDGQPLTRYAGLNSQKNAAIIAEATVIGSQLHDAADQTYCPTALTQYTVSDADSGTQNTRCSINFQRLLVNAPDVESRYIGEFKGVVISEIALFAPGALDFAYDSVFDTVPILPLLPPMLNIPGINPPPAGCTGPLCGGGVIGI